MNLEKFHEIEPYGLSKTEKEKIFFDEMLALTEYHASKCNEYNNILCKLGIDINSIKNIEEIPYIPVRLFKMFDLKSITAEEIFKTMTSSGTTGQSVSKIFLSKENTLNQTKTLTHIISSFIGKQRLPLLLLDTEMVKKDRSMFSARGAGIIGFTTFGRNITYALDENMQLDINKVEQFLAEHNDETILMFGYTYMIWQFVVKELEKQNKHFNIKNGILFHIGGWKKLKAEAIDTISYNKRIQCVLGNVHVYNYYGMAEQLGSVFVECEHGHMHCSNYSDIIIRKPQDFSVCPTGERGLIQLLSVLPSSYPGHSILTEDEGIVLGEDDCPCGRKGKYFKILGRIKNAEIRGCSDTYEKH
ncbi:MAG: acyl-protein synthetase [Spirochaetia bacterium]|nr:acyl-protein synthetase [Spirochaetia bacterium]